jgi:endonuclease/exonuclease/phosphatase family metal-dependent hydrolase
MTSRVIPALVLGLLASCSPSNDELSLYPDAEVIGTAENALRGQAQLDCPASSRGPQLRGELPPSGQHLRVVAANLSSGNDQSYEVDGKRILMGLTPDVVLIQELNHGDNSPAAIRAFVNETFGSSFCYFREQFARIPNGIISRYPIVEAGEWDDAVLQDRDFAWARIDLPGPIDLWAVSVHLRTGSRAIRGREGAALVSAIRQRVPAGAYLVIGGDLNTNSRVEKPLIDHLSQVVRTSGPFPSDGRGNANTNAPRNQPYDWVMPGYSLASREVPVRLGGSLFPNGLVFDTRVFRPLVAPAQPDDSDAPLMQHMAVTRDFVLR